MLFFLKCTPDKEERRTKPLADRTRPARQEELNHSYYYPNFCLGKIPTTTCHMEPELQTLTNVTSKSD